MWQDVASHLTLDQKIWWREEKKGRERRYKRERGERNYNFSLRSMEIGGSVFVEPRKKRSSASQRLRVGTENMRFLRGFK